MADEEESQRRLLAIFRAEAQERLRVVADGLLALEKGVTGEERAQLFERLAREAHSLKGAARSVGLLPVEGLGRALERVLAALRDGSVAPAPSLFDALHQALDAALRFTAAPAQDATGPEPGLLRAATRALERLLPGGGETQPAAAPRPPAPAPEPAVASETVRLPAARLGALLLEAEQLLSARLAEEHLLTELRELARTVAAWRKELAGLRAPATRAASVDTGQVIEQARERLKEIASRLGALESTAGNNLRALGTNVAALLAGLKEVLMLPASTLLGIFPRMVRDIARAEGKEIDVTVEGGEFEIDKRVLDEIKDAVVHLVRNAVDHGIELPAVREQQGKPRRGSITLRVEQHEAGLVELEIADDGAGIDADRIRAAAVRQGVISSQAAGALDAQQSLNLVFRSGVTTSTVVTDISGRGLGLPIVQEKVAALHGSLAIDTVPGRGTRFRIELPLTLATFRGVVVGSAARLFIFPSANVDQVLRADRRELRTVENRPTLAWGGEVVAVADLSQVLGLPAVAPPGDGKTSVVIAGDGTRRVAFAVDSVVNEQEVLVKPLGRQLARVRNIGSAALLGSGAVVPILHVPDLLASALRTPVAAEPAPAASATPRRRARTLLLVEDSITTRTLLRNILEGAGYRVQTAVDGTDAVTRLRERPFDLVVSDVAMPRMDGFDLTATIRADPQLKGLPVVLVTAMESRADRERGIAAGANAYIVKSSFEQGNLLDTIGRLLRTTGVNMRTMPP